MAINLIHTLRAPRQIIFGAGVSTQVASLVSQLGDNVLLVTDSVMFNQPRVKELIHSIESAVESLVVFSDATSDVPLSDVDKVLLTVFDKEIEAIVAVGGGTVIDLAKIVSVILSHGGKPSDYYGEAKVPGPTIPIIAIPTTAGTGSEVTPVSVLSDPDMDLPNIIHAYQTAEAIRKAGLPDWLQLVGLIHDLGKMMYLKGTESDGTTMNSQFSIVGDTFIVGYPIPSTIVYPEFNELNDDNKNGLNMYEPKCGLDNCIVSFGHDEYLFQVLKYNNSSIPEAGLNMIRYHSLYVFHTYGAYT